MNAPTAASEPRSLYWSVRREIWENRSVWLAPLIVASVVLFATAISTLCLPIRLRATSTPAQQHAAIVSPFSMAPAPIMFTTFFVGFIYCLDALYGERRDRSILFWKSLPVSDGTTVLAKAMIPLLILPLIALALGIITQLVLLPFGAVGLAASGRNPGLVFREFHFFRGLPIMIYGLTVHALWFAPIYGWFMLVSAWARRTPVLWALMPPLLISAVERIVSRTWYFMYMLQYRVMGAMKEAFIFDKKGDISSLSQLTPGRFLSAPGLWVGLVFAVACFAIAVRLRRNREPI